MKFVIGLASLCNVVLTLLLCGLVWRDWAEHGGLETHGQIMPILPSIVFTAVVTLALIGAAVAFVRS